MVIWDSLHFTTVGLQSVCGGSLVKLWEVLRPRRLPLRGADRSDTEWI